MVVLRKLSVATLMTDATIDALFVVSRHTPVNAIPRRDSLRDHKSSNSSSKAPFKAWIAAMVIICCHGIPSPQASHQVPGLIRLFGSGFALALALIVAIALALALALIVAFTALAVAFAAAL